MNEPSALDILLEYPKEKGLDYDTNKDSRHFLLPNDPMMNTKYVVFKKEEIFFIAYDSFGAKAFLSKTFSGIYCLLELKDDIDIKIFKKDWLDKFLRKNKVKAGSKFIDNNLTITSDSKRFPAGLISDKAARIFLSLFEKIDTLEVLIQYNHLPFIKELDKKLVIGLEVNRWIYEKEEVDFLLNSGGDLLREIISCAK